MAKREEEKTFKTGAKVNYSTEGIDYFKRVKIKVLAGAKHHAEGSIIEGSETLLRKMIADGTGEKA